MLKKLESNQGITLIALIITIIVLLILAGVTINSLFGDDSIIAKAREAADAYKNSEKEEQKRFDNINKYLNGEEIEEEEELIETNPDFFTYSDPDENDEVLVTGFTTGEGGGEEAYTNNDETALNLVIPKQNKEGKNIKGIGNDAFKDRTKITGLVLQNNIIQLGTTCFSGCTGITDLTVPITINDYKNKFAYCVNISKVKLIKGNNDTEGKDFTAVSSDPNYYGYTPWYISTTENLDIEIQKGITKIGNNMFYSCENLRNITFPDSITQIGSRAFYRCKKMQLNASKIKNLISIGQSAFEECEKLIGKVEINNQITKMGISWFSGCIGITEVVIPGSVTDFENNSYCFSGCTGITSLTIPITVNSYRNSFNSCTNISKIKLIKGNNDTEGKDFVGVNSQANYLGYTPWYISTTENLDIEIEEGITKIGDNMFYSCENLRNITFPDSITQIGSGAFYRCSKMQLNASKIKNLISIGQGAFEDCVGLIGKVEINNQITKMGISWFRGCIGITEVVIPDSVTDFEDNSYCFSNCTGITSLTIPITINTYRNSFNNCTNISKVKLIKGKNDTEGKDFVGNSGPNYLGYIPWYISKGNNQQIIIEKGITKIGKNTFYGLTKATYYYTGTSTEWASVTGTEGIIIPTENFNYAE